MINKKQETVQTVQDSLRQRRMGRREALKAISISFLTAAGLTGCSRETTSPLGSLQKGFETLFPEAKEIPQAAQGEITEAARAIVKEVEKLPEKARKITEPSVSQEIPRVVASESQELPTKTQSTLKKGGK